MDRNEILSKYESKIRNCIRKDFRHSKVDTDDLVQEALIGFNHALDTYNEGNNQSLFNYCYQQAKWRCLDTIKSYERKTRNTDSLDFMLEQHNEFVFENEVVEAQESQSYSLDRSRTLVNVLKKFSAKHQKLLLAELYGIKSIGILDIDLSKNSIARIKRDYKREYLAVTSGQH